MKTRLAFLLILILAVSSCALAENTDWKTQLKDTNLQGLASSLIGYQRINLEFKEKHQSFEIEFREGKIKTFKEGSYPEPSMDIQTEEWVIDAISQMDNPASITKWLIKNRPELLNIKVNGILNKIRFKLFMSLVDDYNGDVTLFQATANSSNSK